MLRQEGDLLGGATGVAPKAAIEVTTGNMQIAGTFNSGAITSSGALNLGANTITSGAINGQTISSAANFTGSLNAVSWADTTLVTNLNADLLDGLTSTTFQQRVSYSTTASNSGYYKINIIPATSWMLSFTIRLYQGYRYDDIRISGYNYGGNYWYTPLADLLNSSATSIDVKFGYDSAYNLWVAVPAAAYTGLEIIDITNGYTQVDQDWSKNFTIVNQASLTGTVQTTQTVYRPLKYNENAVSATTAATANAVSFNGGLTTGSTPTFANVQLGASGYVGLNGGTSYGIGVNSSNRNSASFDTVESAGSTLELNYYSAGAGVTVGDSGTDHSLTVYGTATATTFNGSGSGLTGTASSLTAGNLSNFLSLTSTVNTDTKGTSGITYFSGGTGNPYGDGALYQQAYPGAPTTWGSQIMQDYRTGRLAVRGLNNTNWTTWLNIIDSGNIGSQTVATAGTANAVSFNGGLTTGSSPTFANVNAAGEFYTSNGLYTRMNYNQFYCNNASACYFNNSGTGKTYVGNAAGTVLGGNVGIGTDTTGYMLDVAGSAAFGTGAETMRITGGSVGIGTSAPSVTLQVVGNIKANFAAATNYYASVTATTAGQISYYSSDSRLKTDVEYIQNGLEVINKLKPANYTIIADGAKSSGFIAQDVYGLIPGAATLMSDGYYAFNINGVVAYAVKAIQEQQVQISGLSSAQVLNAQNIQNILAQQELLDGRISGLFDSLQSGLDATNAKILSLENKADDTKNKVSDLGTNLNFVRGQIGSLYGKVLGVETSNIKEEVLISDFASENVYQHSSLDSVDYSDNSFGGTYSAISEFKEIGVDLPTGIDFSQYDMDNAVLQFEVYMQNSNLIQDFVSELGNNMDDKEIQWEESAHPWFTNGWNVVRLSLGSGAKTGEIDWSDLKHFRAYFKFSGRSEVRIKNVKIEARQKSAPIAEGASFALDGQVIKLDSLENQNKLILALDEKAAQSDLVIKSQDDRIQNVETKLADQTALVSAQTELLTTLKVDGILYKDELGNLNLGEGSLIAKNIEAASEVKAKQVKTDTLEMTDNKSSGKSFIPAGVGEIVIETPEASNEAKIYITATGSNYSKTLYVSEEDTVPSVSFKVKFDGDPVANNIKFNWLIIK